MADPNYAEIGIAEKLYFTEREEQEINPSPLNIVLRNGSQNCTEGHPPLAFPFPICSFIDDYKNFNLYFQLKLGYAILINGIFDKLCYPSCTQEEKLGRKV